MARKRKKRVPEGDPDKQRAKGPLTETRKQRIRRLRRAGYTDAPLPKGTPRKTKRGLREKARREAVRLIAKSEGITIKEARKRYKKSLVEIIWENPLKTTYRKFFRVSEGKFLEFEPGRPAKMEYTFGPVRSSAYVQRIMSLKKYWNTVHLIAETWDIPVSQARNYYKKTVKQFGPQQGPEVILIDLGLYEESYEKR